MALVRMGRKVAVTAAAFAAVGVLATAPANAGTATGWTSTAGADAQSRQYLNNSTIVTDPQEAVAYTKVWISVAANADPGTMGAFARLFKSGVLCAASPDYQYNNAPASAINASAGLYANCGTGSYNSHGATKVWNGTQYNTYYTFPSSAQNYPG